MKRLLQLCSQQEAVFDVLLVLQFVILGPEHQGPCILAYVRLVKVNHLRGVLHFKLGFAHLLRFSLFGHAQKPAVDVPHPIVSILDDIPLAPENPVLKLDFLRDSLLIPQIILLWQHG